MKHKLLYSCMMLLGIARLTATDTYAQSGTTPDAVEAVVKQIRTDYEQINKAKLTKKAVPWSSPDSCSPPMEGTVTYFYKDNQLVKIYNEGGEDHGEWKEEYYFRNGAVFFIYQNNAYGGAVNPVEFKYQNRYYFDQGKLIRKIESKGESEVNSDLSDLVTTATQLYATTDAAKVARIMGCGE